MSNSVLRPTRTALALALLSALSVPVHAGQDAEPLTPEQRLLRDLGARSTELLTQELKEPPADIVIFVTASACRWRYEYRPPEGRFTREQGPALTEGEERGRALAGAARQAVLVPVDKVVRLDVTADPSTEPEPFVVPAFGIRTKALPGRIEATWFKAAKTGVYFGSFSTPCATGRNPTFVAIQVVDAAQFETWAESNRRAEAGQERR